MRDVGGPHGQQQPEEIQEAQSEDEHDMITQTVSIPRQGGREGPRKQHPVGRGPRSAYGSGSRQPHTRRRRTGTMDKYQSDGCRRQLEKANLEELPPLQQAGEQQNEEEAVDGAMEGGISRRRKLRKLWANVRESAVRGQEEVMGTDSEESTLALPLNFASFSPRRLGITWSVYLQGDQVLLRTVVSRQGPAGHQASRCKQG